MLSQRVRVSHVQLVVREADLCHTCFHKSSALRSPDRLIRRSPPGRRGCPIIVHPLSPQCVSKVLPQAKGSQQGLNPTRKRTGHSPHRCRCRCRGVHQNSFRVRCRSFPTSLDRLQKKQTTKNPKTNRHLKVIGSGLLFMRTQGS